MYFAFCSSFSVLPCNLTNFTAKCPKLSPSDVDVASPVVTYLRKGKNTAGAKKKHVRQNSPAVNGKKGGECISLKA